MPIAYLVYLRLMQSEPMTWALLRKQIAAGRSQPRVVWCREGSYCGRCAAPLRGMDSVCRGCQGGTPHIEQVKG